MSIDLFLILLLPLLVYGFIMKLWTESRTTVMVFITAFVVIFQLKFYDKEVIFFEIYLFLLFLFVRAVFRKRLKNHKNSYLKRLFYA